MDSMWHMQKMVFPTYLTFYRVHVLCEWKCGEQSLKKKLKDNQTENLDYNCPKCRVKPKAAKKQGKKKAFAKQMQIY